MAATCEGVTLPDDLRPDDSILICDDDWSPVYEIDSDDEIMGEWTCFDRYVDHALTFYNNIHGTDYKVVKNEKDLTKNATLCRDYDARSPVIRCGFIAVQSGNVESDSKHLCANLQPYTFEVFSCCIVEESDGCRFCFGTEEDLVFAASSDPKPPREPFLPALSEYGHQLAEGVTLSGKAEYRIRTALLALAYYNKKQHKEYKIVDILPLCISLKRIRAIAAHGNFIARESGLADAPNRLFFFEQLSNIDGWVVTCCRIVRGKTNAGCYNCPPMGKKVIHPLTGFRYGLYPFPDRPSRLR